MSTTVADKRTLIKDALFGARCYMHSSLRHICRSDLSPLLLDTLTLIDRALGATMERTSVHDAGAIARCSACGRYTVDARALSHNLNVACDCGSEHHWSGSFVSPGPDAQWALCLRCP